MYGNPPPQPGYGYGAPQPQWGNNPYAPPQPGMGAPTMVAQPGAGGWLKWAYTACLGIGFLGVTGGMMFAALDDDDDGALAALGGGMMVLGGSMWFVRIIFGLIWLYSSWDSLPPEMRVTKTRRMSPGEAVGFCFIPFYNLYWIFAANVGLCDALDYGLMSVGSYRRGPRAAAIVACIFQLVPYLNFIISPFTWLIYMFLADSARFELLTRLAQGQAGMGGPPPMGAMPQVQGGGYGPPGFNAPPYGGYPPPY